MIEKDQAALVQSIQDNLETGKISQATLATDDRILARITDGIYRQPASALRELIANAYDADATNVYIQTDLPRFRTITVRDNGNGLTVNSLANLIFHIGGSPKRTVDGIKLGVVSRGDPALSPNGRRLIGKIGIGLFSVAQLTRRFQIITKTKGSNHRLVAEVVLKTYTEDDLAKVSADKRKVETGSVRIRAVKATDKDAHGTDIVLFDVRRQTRDLLQSRDMWAQLEAGESEEQSDKQNGPAYHISRLAANKDDVVKTNSVLPWKKSDPPGQRFSKLVQAVIDEVESSVSNPRLETVLDNYLRMLWTLSLSAPLDYIEKHPFDLNTQDNIDFFQISDDKKGGKAKPIRLAKTESLRSHLGLKAPERGSAAPFDVFIDDVQLKRPVRFKDLPKTHHIISKPMLFVGSAAPDLSKISEADRGGDLAFEAYLMWAPKVVPKEHNGLLVRISDASGTLFDETFMKYQVAELTRLRQITAEVFVHKGLDAALNIDRESFNYAHPHYQYLLKWVHRSIRQLTNAHKTISSERRTESAEAAHEARSRRLETTVRKRLRSVAKPDEISPVEFVEDKPSARKIRRGGALAFESGVVFADLPAQERATNAEKKRREHFEAQVSAVAQILEAYGVFEHLRYDAQQEMLRAIVAVFAERDS